MNAFQEHMRFSRSDYVASRAVAAAEWGILLGTLLTVILLPVVKWDEFWFCMIFGVGFPLVGIVQSAWNFSSHPVGCDASFQNGILQFAERFSYDEKEPFSGPTVSIPLEKCRWRWGYMENLVTCRPGRFSVLSFSSVYPWRRVPVLEIVFFHDGRNRVYPLGFTQEARSVWLELLTETGVSRLRDRWRGEMLIHGIFLYLSAILLGVCLRVPGCPTVVWLLLSPCFPLLALSLSSSLTRNTEWPSRLWAKSVPG